MSVKHDEMPPRRAHQTPHEQRRMLSSTPPAPRWLTAHPFEDAAIRTIVRTGRLDIERFDIERRRTTDLTDEHLGAIRLFDRNLISLSQATPTVATWTWSSTDAESDALAMLRHRTLGFLPYNLAYREMVPETMSGPQLVAMLVWHYRHTGIHRLDLAAHTATVQMTMNHTTGTEPTTTNIRLSTPATAHPDLFRDECRVINPHADNSALKFSEPVLERLCRELVLRVGPNEFAQQRLTVDLNNWRLRPYATTPSTFCETLDLDVQDALGCLDAPTFHTPSELLSWATTNLTMTVMCRLPERRASNTRPRHGSRKHTVRLNPIDRSATTVAGPDAHQHAEMESLHLLAALSGETERLRCRLLDQAWAGNGLVENTETVKWTQVQAERVLAIHRIADAVQRLFP